MCMNMYITSVTQRWQKTLKSVAYSKECLPPHFTLFVCLIMTTRTMRRDRLEQLRNDTLVREATLPRPLDKKKRCFFRSFFYPAAVTLLWRTRLWYIMTNLVF